MFNLPNSINVYEQRNTWNYVMCNPVLKMFVPQAQRRDSYRTDV